MQNFQPFSYRSPSRPTPVTVDASPQAVTPGPDQPVVEDDDEFAGTIEGALVLIGMIAIAVVAWIYSRPAGIIVTIAEVIFFAAAVMDFMEEETE